MNWPSQPLAAPYAARIAQVRQRFEDAGLDGMLVTSPPNLRYLVGFGSSGALLVTTSGAHLVAPGRYVTGARERLTREGLVDVRLERAEHGLEETVAPGHHHQRSVATGSRGRCDDAPRFDRLSHLLRHAATGAASRPAPRLRPIQGLVERARLVKDTVEIGILRRAARRLSSVAQDVWAPILAGHTERGIAIDVDLASGEPASIARLSRPLWRLDRTAPCRMPGRDR